MYQTLKKRGKKSTASATTADADFPKIVTDEKLVELLVSKDPELHYWIALSVVTAFAAFLRFRILGFPDKVVFDEVHFGKFASYYLERTYFFDLHPPFAKLIIALAGWLVGYDGSFKFENIGDNYIANNVPYVAYRAFLAIQGTLVVPVMFLTMKTLNFSVIACILSSSLVAFDNAHVVDSRLILLDATLILSVAVTIFSYSKFSVYRRQPFTQWWWIWLLLTGVALSCVISTKYVGVFTFFTIGIAVVHELWILLDIRKGLTIEDFSKHFVARLFSLIIVPFCIYLFWFYLHFQILSKSGPGDAFMTSDFQETLEESALVKTSKTVNYFDILTIKHKDTEAFLHSHDLVYPLRYENGRVSSNLQQVTCIYNQDGNELEDQNSQWEILPSNSAKKGEAVFTNDAIRLRHVGTGGYLLTHDVASPLKGTNEEFVVVNDEIAEARYNETLFRLRLSEGGNSDKLPKRKILKTKASPLKIIHIDTVVAMWTHNDELLPEWALGQQEVSGNKKVPDSDNIWVVDEIVGMPESDARNHHIPKTIVPMPFLKKWWELQGLMFFHNNQLSSEHPFASSPDAWPLAYSGVSFWNDNEERKQIFFIGNVIGFWAQVGFLAVYVGFVAADLVTSRRNYHILSAKSRSTMYNTLGFLFIGWAAHYLPFFLMNRQKFLHHYLPAHLIAALFTGGFAEFLCTNRSNSIQRGLAPSAINKPKFAAMTVVIVLGTMWFFWYTRFLVYGNFTLPPAEIKERQWLDISLHYVK
ncbi:dolichyl-phosphate-mannose-protein mannosyltransferase 4 [Metschnikowia bicuspidata var. bicuspidata NRRL YB-4993]|uniref:Dolichyl-phosphate-mannose--protein mannosyltransferase n=1 Tax=Metschnikowia bicuspidata var. bicuspidata NRRL YB-4993 TaxID=869754 RepID=A0A1A0HCD1_9ASCO|nr:dolichyl-phosphate-mannose-protein mannosyltransferase 4 [Metschnikowia bicuspidata var. bicuspidata NRRL YB-4993]OBA21563.1 dolichyl-phosphate-mannose-protein mannosyltransferase 4 [Metschnikowia bicuspidata var. bicuspidata NRRL YB-4993]